MDRERVYRIHVYGGKMKTEDFALSILTLVNYRSSVKESIIDIKTVEGTNTVIVDSYKDISTDLKRMFNTDEVQVEPLTVFSVDWCDLGSRVEAEIEDLVYNKDEAVLIISE